MKRSEKNKDVTQESFKRKKMKICSNSDPEQQALSSAATSNIEEVQANNLESNIESSSKLEETSVPLEAACSKPENSNQEVVHSEVSTSKSIIQATYSHPADHPLHRAIRAKGLKNVKEILSAGEKPCIGDGENCFSVPSNLSILKELLKFEPLGVILKRADGSTLLMKYPHYYKQFLKLGADPYASSKSGNMLIQMLKHACSPKFIDVLVELGVDVNSRDNQGRTPLMLALTYVRHSDLIAAERLVAAGSDPNACDSTGKTVLTYAIFAKFDAGKETKCLEIVEDLIKAGADVNAGFKNRDGTLDSQLYKAICGSKFEAAKLLIKYGANVKERRKDGSTLLMSAVNESIISLIQSLIDAGAEINIQDKQGVNALMLACIRGNSEIIELLVNSGADVAQTDQFGRNVLFYCLLSNSVTIVNAEHGPKFKDQQFILKLLIKAGTSITHAFDVHDINIFYRLIELYFNVAPHNKLQIYNLFSATQYVVEKLKTLNIDDVVSCGKSPQQLFFKTASIFSEYTSRGVNDQMFDILLDSPFKDLNMICEDPFMFYSDLIKECVSFHDNMFVNAIGRIASSATKCNAGYRMPSSSYLIKKDFQETLNKLYNIGFQVETIGNSKPVLSPLTVLMGVQIDEEEENKLLPIVEQMIDNGADVEHKILKFRKTVDETYRPSDALWIATATGKASCVRLLLQYYSHHPLYLLLDLPKPCEELYNALKKVYPVLLQMGGPAPKYLEDKVEEQIRELSYCYPPFHLFLKQLFTMQRSVPSLQHLCCYCLRRSIVQDPETREDLSSIELPQNLKLFFPFLDK